MLRRSLIRGMAAAPALAMPAQLRSATATTLRFVPVVDLAFLDPIVTGAYVTRNHGYMVFDTLYGMDSNLGISPQMVEGHVVSDDDKRWDLTLREGLLWHDGTKVLARDCVASIRRWAKRDAFGEALLAATDELSASDDRTIRFRLKYPFPLLPTALGKVSVTCCFMMPERLANTDAFQQVPEMVGSGPFRFRADERVAGVRSVYDRFEGYRPRADGVSDWVAGPKVVHYDRVVWSTMPDAATGTAAVQAGEQDWQEATLHDLVPTLRRNRNLTIDVLDPRGFTCQMRMNCLQPPFDNPAIRRAVMGAIDQAAFVTAIAGSDPAFQLTPLGFFPPGTPLASDAGVGALSAPRDYDRVRRDLAAAGYKGEKVVLLVPADSFSQKALGDVAAGLLREAGMNVEYTALDFGSVLQRRNRRTPVEEGGWSLFVINWQALDWMNPAIHATLRGDGAFPGWFTSPRMEALRERWFSAPTLADQQRVSQEMQSLAFEEVPFYPLGVYRQPTLYRKSVTNVNRGTPTFWSVRPA
ncbi:ABC transporter substrate-binding protein [Roseococcus pinisoli]|uniref:ABC transporter substrate-binding protein n=1 Tax=Roseococcus pinisoli TaxID=2835040 RepID=A0ABS5QEE8_9PROT|nr:ABC transporter substrate-binding protein [Roseococcus pinisoli]MBS7810948.1 ABC transporter substrate-binding protein [Roseococcus pinisoli]